MLLGDNSLKGPIPTHLGALSGLGTIDIGAADFFVS